MIYKKGKSEIKPKTYFEMKELERQGYKLKVDAPKKPKKVSGK